MLIETIWTWLKMWIWTKTPGILDYSFWKVFPTVKDTQVPGSYASVGAMKTKQAKMFLRASPHCPGTDLQPSEWHKLSLSARTGSWNGPEPAQSAAHGWTKKCLQLLEVSAASVPSGQACSQTQDKLSTDVTALHTSPVASERELSALSLQVKMFCWFLAVLSPPQFWIILFVSWFYAFLREVW